MQCAASLDSLLALSPTSRSTADTADPRESKTSSRSNSSSSTSTATLESLDFTSSLSMTTTTTTSTSDQMMNTDTSTPTPAAAAPGSGKENAVHSNSNSNVDANAIDEFLTGKMSCNNTTQMNKTTQKNKKKTKECTSCHLPKCRDEYSASQWKKKNNNQNSNSGVGRRCIECISNAQQSQQSQSKHAQNKAVMAAAVAIGTVGAVCASVDANGASTSGATGNNSKKKKGLTDRTNSNDSNTAQDDDEVDDAVDVEMADMDDTMMGDDDEDDDDALTLTNFDQTNASLLTVEQSPAKQMGENNVNGKNSANGIAAMEPIIGVLQEEETPRTADGQVFAGFSPVTTTNTAGDTNVNSNAIEQEVAEVEVKAAVEDEALMSTYSFSLYEAEISLERIWSLKSASSDDPANILTVATDALALPCFKTSVLRDLTTTCSNKNQQTISGSGEITVCSPTVNSMASMFATHASAFTSPSVTASADNNNGAGSPLRLTGIDTRHLADVYAQLQIVAAQSELALNDADAALTRMESILRGVVGGMGASDDADDEDALVVTEMNTSGILELGLVLSDAYWVVGDATKADAVRQILTDYTKQPMSSDEADMAATGSLVGTGGMTSSVQDLAATLLSVMESDEGDVEDELAPITEADEDEAEEEKELVVAAITTAKHVHFATTTTSSTDTDNSSSRSPVADELNDVSGRKIATSILKGGGYPEAGTTEGAEPNDLTAIAEDQSSRPDVVKHLYHNYRSTFEFGKAHIPVGGMLLGLAEGTASTSIKIASLGHLDLQAIDENFIGPHVVKGLDDVIANPIIETVGGVVDGIGGAVGAVISVLPFVGGGGSEEEKE